MLWTLLNKLNTFWHLLELKSQLADCFLIDLKVNVQRLCLNANLTTNNSEISVSYIGYANYERDGCYKLGLVVTLWNFESFQNINMNPVTLFHGTACYAVEQHTQISPALSTFSRKYRDVTRMTKKAFDKQRKMSLCKGSVDRVLRWRPKKTTTWSNIWYKFEPKQILETMLETF